MLAACPNLSRPTIRPLTADDTSAYRALRQKVLAVGDGRFFSDSYMREAQLNEKQWQEWCTETTEHCIFGTFHKNCMIGVMMITQHGEPKNHMVEWEAIWLDPRYRRQGIAKLAYEQIRRWTLGQGYEHVALYIRADNLRSQQIHRKQGAHYLHTKYDEVWADGSIEDTRCFWLNLYPTHATKNYIQNRAPAHLETTNASLNQISPNEIAIYRKVA
jgi:RimJ/RimL family protein N-acetyltransferase